MTLVPGIVAVNVVFLVVGFALLGRARWHVSWAGVALLVGAGAVATGVFFAVLLGARATLLVAALVAAALASVGIAISPAEEAPAEPRAARDTVWSGGVFGLVTAVCAVGLVGGFRSSPWLDDAWGIWLPKGLALWHHGLDERLFAPGGEYVSFGVPDYPLWWSIVCSLDVQAVGELDVRVMSAQLSLLTVAFVGAVARLLWGYVRPSVLAFGLLLLVLSAEVWRHVQGGVADLALAIYVALFALGLALWIGARERTALVVAAVGGVTAAQVKTEGIAELLVVAAVAAVAARPRGRLAGVLLAAGAAVASTVPWLTWRIAYDVPSRAPLSVALDLSAVERVRPTVEELVSQLLDPLSWSVIVLALVFAGVFGYRKYGRIEWLLPTTGLLAGFAFLLWAYWTNPDEIGFLLSTSAYRTIDPLVLCAAVFVPIEVEYLLRR